MGRRDGIEWTVGHIKIVVYNDKLNEDNDFNWCMPVGVYSSLTSVGYVKQSMVQDGRVLEAAKALNNTLPKDANLLVVDRYAQSIVYHSDRTAWRLNRLDEPVVSMLVEDGVEYIAVLDPIEGDSDVQILQSIQRQGKFSPWLIWYTHSHVHRRSYGCQSVLYERVYGCCVCRC